MASEACIELWPIDKLVFPSIGRPTAPERSAS
jgi:hypothetical protein